MERAGMERARRPAGHRRSVSEPVRAPPCDDDVDEDDDQGGRSSDDEAHGLGGAEEDSDGSDGGGLCRAPGRAATCHPGQRWPAPASPAGAAAPPAGRMPLEQGPREQRPRQSPPSKASRLRPQRWLAAAHSTTSPAAQPPGSPRHRRRSSRMQRFLPGEEPRLHSPSRSDLSARLRASASAAGGGSGSAADGAGPGEAEPGGASAGADRIAPYVPAPRPLRNTNMLLSFQEEGTIAEIPAAVAVASRLVYVLATVMAACNVALDLVTEVGWLPHMPHRFNYVVLTVVCAMLGYQCRNGILKRERDVMLDVSSAIIFVTLGMVFSDVYFAASQGDPDTRRRIAAYRAPFIMAALFIALTVVYMLLHLRLLPILRSRPLPVSPSFYPRLDTKRRLSDPDLEKGSASGSDGGGEAKGGGCGRLAAAAGRLVPLAASEAPAAASSPPDSPAAPSGQGLRIIAHGQGSGGGGSWGPSSAPSSPAGPFGLTPPPA